MLRGTVLNSHKAPHFVAGYCYVLQRQQVHGFNFSGILMLCFSKQTENGNNAKLGWCYAIYELSTSPEERKSMPLSVLCCRLRFLQLSSGQFQTLLESPHKDFMVELNYKWH